MENSVIAINFISSKDAKEDNAMHLKNNNIEFTSYIMIKISC